MTPDQITLLRGVLLTGDDGTRSMTDWCSTTELDSVDESSHRLLPLLFRRLSEHDLAPRHMDRLRGVYRKTWYRNQQHMAAVTRAIQLLDGEGVTHALVGDLPIALMAYGDSGARMVRAARLVVPPADVARAVSLFSRNGFNTIRSAREYGLAIPTVLTTPGGGVIDVRGSVYGPGWSDAPDQDVWDQRVPTEIGGFRASTLDATDTLVEAACSAASTRQSWLLGLADVALLTQLDDSAVDWAQLTLRYGGTPMSVALQDALTDLLDKIAIPLGVGAAKWHGEYELQLEDRIKFWTHRNGRRLLRLPAWYRRVLLAQDQRISLAGFISFARAVYDIKSPADAMQRLTQRARFWRS